jgi:dipeptidyl-peptidase-3
MLKKVEDFEKTEMNLMIIIRNGLMTQLVRLEFRADIEKSHMRNRQWVSAWAFEKGKER